MISIDFKIETEELVEHSNWYNSKMESKLNLIFDPDIRIWVMICFSFVKTAMFVFYLSNGSINIQSESPNHNLWKPLSDFKLVSLTQDLIEGPKDQLVPFEYKENKTSLSLFFTLALSFTIQYKVTKTEIKMDCIERDKTHQVLTFLSVYYIKYIFNIQSMLAKTLTMNRPISNVRSKSLFLMFNILTNKASVLFIAQVSNLYVKLWLILLFTILWSQFPLCK